MEIYYYCSYTGSPVGFILGKLSDTYEAEETVELSEVGIDPLIRRCFEQGMVRNACGILTQEPRRYFLLLKKLVARGGRDSVEYYLNLAFVTESQQQYQQWLDQDDTVTADTIAQAGRETIVLDQESDFGYKVRSMSLSKLAKMRFGALLGKCRMAALEDGLYFELASQNADVDEVMQALGISNAEHDFELVSKDENWVRLIKKKAKQGSRIIWGLLLVAMILLILLRIFKH